MSALERLFARIEKRSGALRAAHEQAVPRGVRAGQIELDRLGPYVAGEPRATSLRRAFLTRWLERKCPVKGRYGTQRDLDYVPLPRTLGLAREELLRLGVYVPGEPGHDSRRRAALLRRFPALAFDVIQLSIDALGTYAPGEPDAITKRRGALVRQRDRMLNRPAPKVV